MIVICAVPDLLGSAILVAEIETMFGLGAMPGAAYSPIALTVPTADVPPCVPFTAHATAVLNAPVPFTVAMNCCVPVVGKDAEGGMRETEVMVGDGGGGGVGGVGVGAGLTEPPPHPIIRVPREVKHAKESRNRRAFKKRVI